MISVSGLPGQYIKKKLGVDHEQLLKAFFSCFRGQNFFFNFFENTMSALKNCIINFKKQNLLNFFWNKTVFLGLR